MESEMKYKTEFPDFVLDVEIPAGFNDNSWHNNAMPCWYRELPDGQMVVLWIDYADPALRDNPNNARFVLHVMDSTLTDVDDSFVTNDFAEIVAKLIDHFFPWIDCTYDQLIEFRAELWAKVPDNDHARNSKEMEMIAEIDDELSKRGIK
jgi:hypothetical protein